VRIGSALDFDHCGKLPFARHCAILIQAGFAPECRQVSWDLMASRRFNISDAMALSAVISVFAIGSGHITGNPDVIPPKRESAPVHLIRGGICLESLWADMGGTR
jgi:hypothetical protein